MTERLARFLRDEIYPAADDVAIAEMERPIGGASWETFFLKVSVRQGGDDALHRLVMKRAPATGPLAPYDARKDATIFRTLHPLGVPVPHLLAWTEDPSIFERPFTITAFIEGESHDITKVERWPVWQEQREALGHAIVDTLAAVQAVDWRGTDLPLVLGPRGGAPVRAAHAVDRFLTPLLELAEERGIRQPLWREMGQWIKDNAPDTAEDDLVLVHGDYRFGNFLWQGTRIVGVVDWERAMLGPPMQELGFICMPLSRRLDPTMMGKALPFDQLAARYERATGRTVDLGQIQYYGVLWQYIEGVNGTRGALGRGSRVASTGVISPNLVARQTLQLIEDYEAGRDLR